MPTPTTHVRQQIREAIATAVTSLTTTGARVYQSRVYPLEDANLPALLVQTVSEQSQPATIHAPRVMERTLRVDVVGIAKANDSLDDTLDTICKEVEVALADPSGLRTLAKDIVLTGAEIGMVGSAERPVGRAAMQFAVTYFTKDNAPTVAL